MPPHQSERSQPTGLRFSRFEHSQEQRFIELGNFTPDRNCQQLRRHGVEHSVVSSGVIAQDLHPFEIHHRGIAGGVQQVLHVSDQFSTIGIVRRETAIIAVRELDDCSLLHLFATSQP